MTDLSLFDPNSVANPNNNIFGLPFSEEEARLVIIPVPWEVTVSFGSGTARSSEQIMKASLQVDLFDPDVPDGWRQGFFMQESDKKVLLKSDLNGYMRNGYFECTKLQMKCPSKYKDDMKAAEKNLPTAAPNQTDYKY